MELDFDQGDIFRQQESATENQLAGHDQLRFDQQDYDEQEEEQRQLTKSLQITNRQEIPIHKSAVTNNDGNDYVPQQMSRHQLQQRRSRFSAEQNEPEIIDFGVRQDNPIVEEDRPAVDLDERISRKPQGRVLKVNVNERAGQRGPMNQRDQQILDFFGITD